MADCVLFIYNIVLEFVLIYYIKCLFVFEGGLVCLFL